MKAFLASFLTLTATVPVAAHAGDHHGFGLLSALEHLVTQPFHMAGLALIVVVALAVRWMTRGKSRGRPKPDGRR
ncbi:hypothetical protein [Kordiimonas aestuarii]|uniref:hypothetical protein n=1 Tax=Kordiimonas aestuarii TaxID=1005925 RepID=UPI0021D22CC8|nr:hypothetical protein [Kordiimonas aestuarii]